tara:strand:- start:741 stop:1424 length:684 start_codon:yes stop_codon:yes gene_type:complete
MNTEEDIKRLCQNFLQSYEEGNCAYDNELSKQPDKHYYRMKTTKQFFNDLYNCSELTKHSKEINHLINLIKTPQYVREKELINKNRLLKKQIENLHDKLKGHTRFTCPQCSCNIKEMAKKWNEDHIKKNNLEIHQATIERQGEHIAKYNVSCRRLERKIADKDEFIKELKSTITDLKTASIHLELESKKKKKKKTSLSKKQQKQMMKLLQQMKDTSSEEESSSDDEY